MTDDKKTTPNDDDDRTLDAKAKELWQWLMARKIHIIPVFLWIDAALGLTMQRAISTLVIIVTYYLLFLFPGFYRKWKKNHPAPDE